MMNDDMRPAGSESGAELPSASTPSGPAGKPTMPRKPIVRVRLFLASVLCLLTLAATIPNLGHIDPRTQNIRWGTEDMISPAVILTPLILIFVGYGRSKIVEGVGWLSLIAMLLLRFSI
jgi:hypothetical protein